MKHLFLLSIIVLSFCWAQSQELNQDRFYWPVDNDAGNLIDDHPTPYVDLKDLSPAEQLKLFLHQVRNSPFAFQKSFEYVMSALTPKMENLFDAFILVNTARHNHYDPYDLVPAQRMRILVRDYYGQPIFLRNSSGVYGFASGVSGVDESAIAGLPKVLKVSTGAGNKRRDPQPYVDTFSGIYRVNYKKSKDRPFSKGMNNSLYVDYRYRSGRASGIAVHGTTWSKNNLRNLGTRQSHGCVRIHPKYSPALYKFVMGRKMYSQETPHLNRRQQLPGLQYDESGHVATRPGPKALMIFFNGFEARSI